MSDHTPSTNRVRNVWIGATITDGDIEGAGAAFDRWLQTFKAEVLREAADEVGAWGPAAIPAATALRARADELSHNA